MKKLEFWAHKSNLILGIPMIIILLLIFLSIGIIEMPKSSIFWPMITMSIICLIFLIYILFFDKRTLSKVKFSEKGIELVWLGRDILFVDWYDIKEVKSTPRGKGAEDLSIISNTTQVDIGLTKQMYNTIIQICPNPLVKIMINDIECFKCFH